MSTPILILLLILTIVLTGLILIQRSEGGALGIGGGGGGGGFMSGRSAASSVSRMTGILGAAFMVLSLGLAIVFNRENVQVSLIDDTNEVQSLTPGAESVEDVLPSETLLGTGAVTPDEPEETDLPVQTENEPEPTPETESDPDDDQQEG